MLQSLGRNESDRVLQRRPPSLHTPPMIIEQAQFHREFLAGETIYQARLIFNSAAACLRFQLVSHRRDAEKAAQTSGGLYS
jgi:hypothetical protein